MKENNIKKIKKRATSSSFLKNRITFNKKHQKTDFKSWQYGIYKKVISKLFKLKKVSQVRILDVGSGNGLQVSHFIKIFRRPEIWCLDYSKKSLNLLRQKYRSNNIKIVKLDMDKLDSFIQKKKLKNYFHITHSSYALYYAKNQKKVLNSMKNSLVKDGLFLVSAPTEPHEMVNFLNEIYQIPPKVLKTLKFYKQILLPYLRKNAKKNIFKKKINYIKFEKKDEFLNFWKNTTYYNNKFTNKVTKELKEKKSLKFKKIIGVACSVKK